MHLRRHQMSQRRYYWPKRQRAVEQRPPPVVVEQRHRPSPELAWQLAWAAQHVLHTEGATRRLG